MTMKMMAVFIAVFFLMFVGGYAHEGDLIRQCKEKGTAAGWQGELICSQTITQ